MFWRKREEVFDEQKWMAYIDQEIRETCEAKDWDRQIRRDWRVREKPVAESSIEDYEWKIMPGTDKDHYYLLRFEPSRCKFILQHDTNHCGVGGRHWQWTTYTEIVVAGPELALISDTGEIMRELERCPPRGWLRDHLLDLTTRFGPNFFSIT